MRIYRIIGILVVILLIAIALKRPDLLYALNDRLGQDYKTLIIGSSVGGFLGSAIFHLLVGNPRR